MTTGSYDTDEMRRLAASLRRTSGELQDVASALTRGGLPLLPAQIHNALGTFSGRSAALVRETADSGTHTATALVQAAQRYDDLDQAIIACMSF